MQKATATAKEAGLSFEWLGTYIATLSEKTRQAPESIGTALNSLMTRIHAIRKTGYNDEDETDINDVNRALATIGVTLMDQNGQWRDLNLVFDDVAAQWDTMTDKQRSYISTTMAGTRQANYFKTLMQDLSKGVEGGSRAWELYEGALNSAGTAMEKYAIWEESVEAAQNRLTAATEEFYSILSGGAIRGWYDMWANVVNGLNETTEATGGMNLTMGAGAAAVTLLTLSLIKLRAEAGAANISLGKQMVETLTGVTMTANGAAVATNMLGITLRGVGAGVAIVGLVQLVKWIISLRDNAEETAKKTAELAETLQDGFSKSGGLNRLSQELRALEGSTADAGEQIEAFNELRRQMIAAFPEMSDRLGSEVTKVGELEGAYENAKAALIELQKEQMHNDWATAHEGAGMAAANYANAMNKRSSASEKGLIDEMRRLTSGDPTELMEQYGRYAMLTMKSVEGLTAQSNLLQKALGHTSSGLMEQAWALGMTGDSIEEVKTKLQAYAAEQERLEQNSAMWSDTRRKHQNNKTQANLLLEDIRIYEDNLDNLTSEIKPKIEQMAALNGASFQLNMSPDGTGGVVSAKVAPIKWTGTGSGGSRSGGGSSGGGGGSSSTSVSSSVEKMLGSIESAKELRDFRRELAQTAQAYHESRGEIQGVILYLEKEKEIVQENIGALDTYIAQIEKEIREKQAVIASNKEGGKAYRQAMSRMM